MINTISEEGQVIFCELLLLVSMANCKHVENIENNQLLDDFERQLDGVQNLSVKSLFSLIEKERILMMLDVTQELQIENFFHKLFSEENISGTSFFSQFSTIFDSKYFNYIFIESLIESSQKISNDNYLTKSDSFQQELIQKVMGQGGTFMDLTTDGIQKAIMLLPNIRILILKESVKCFFEKRNQFIKNSDLKERKIILCTLMENVMKNDFYSDFEKDLINLICLSMKIDNEYFSEFQDVLIRLTKANKELTILLNE